MCGTRSTTEDILEAALDELQSADNVVLEGNPLPPSTVGERYRSGTLASDLFLDEQADVRRTHWQHAHVLGVHLPYGDRVSY